MSGFLAACGAPEAVLEPAVLERMVEAMAFRGPDGRGTWTGPGVALGWTRLETARGGPGQLPVTTPDGALRIVGSVRLDDPGAFRRRLGDLPAADPATDSDLALVLALYEQRGVEALDALRGEYAFALWDGRRRRLVCARDPFGVRPLYHVPDRNVVLVGNTLEALCLHPVVSDRLDERAVTDFLMFGRPWEPDATAYADVRRVPPGHRLVVEDGRSQLVRGWRLAVSPSPLPMPAVEIPGEFLRRLEAAVADRSAGERAVVFMSGGLDSTTVAALARQAVAAHGAGGVLLACTMVLDSVLQRVAWRPMPSEEEVGYARSVAGRLRIQHRVLDFGHAPLFERWQVGRGVPPEPIDAPHLGVLLDTAGELARAYRVGLTGEGGDACLRPPVDRAGRPAGRLGLLRLIAGIGRFARTRGRLPGLALRTRIGRRLGRAKLAPPFPPWFEPDVEARLGLRERFADWLASIPGYGDPDTERRVDEGPRPEAWRDLTSPWWPHAFWGWDPEVTRAPLEFRHPFFDLRVVEFVLSLPPVPWFWEKYLLRQATAGILPDELRRRPKAVDRVASRHRLVLREGPEAMRPNEEALSGLGPWIRIPALERLMTAPERLLSNEIRLISRPLTLGWWLKHQDRSAASKVAGES